MESQATPHTSSLLEVETPAIRYRPRPQRPPASSASIAPRMAAGKATWSPARRSGTACGSRTRSSSWTRPPPLARIRSVARASALSRPTATVLASMPDDVDAVVEIFDQFSDMIERSVKGTAAEPLFEEYGPAFSLVALNERLEPGAPAEQQRLGMRLHAVFGGEIQALEGAARSLWDFPDAPWEFKMNMARQCWDEARHVQIYEKLLEHSSLNKAPCAPGTLNMMAQFSVLTRLKEPANSNLFSKMRVYDGENLKDLQKVGDARIRDPRFQDPMASWIPPPVHSCSAFFYAF